MFSGCSAPGSVQYSMVPSSSALVSTRSANRNPAASSRSAPGVRMMTANDRPCSRTSRGSSAAAQSVAPKCSVPRTRVTATVRKDMSGTFGDFDEPVAYKSSRVSSWRMALDPTRGRRWIAAVALAGGIVAGLAALYWYSDPETLDLDDAVRRATPGQFVRLTDGYTHYEIAGPPAG